MKSVRTIALISLIGLSAGLALAQPASGPGTGPGPVMGAGPAASAPGMGPGGGRGPGHGPGRMGPDNTPGWGLMSRQERDAHRDHLRAMKSYDECQAYMAQHHEQMTARAKERGVKVPAQPRRDACARLKK